MVGLLVFSNSGTSCSQSVQKECEAAPFRLVVIRLGKHGRQAVRKGRGGRSDVALQV